MSKDVKMADGFRIGHIAIEGFKGFTTRKEVDLQNRHVFLLGSNGNGKSSVIEAIRWGLFGSTYRPNDMVANRGYPKRCRVEIGLLRAGKEWHLRRTLIRGVSAGSDARLFDDTGNERHIREIMPQLDSLDAGEGTHIIFAPQSAPLKRQPEDLSPFERTVFNHLGLTHARALLGHLETFLLELSQDEEQLDERLSELRRQVDGQIAALEEERGRALKSPSWGEGKPPIAGESENKARLLIGKINGAERDQGVGLSLWALVEQAEEALKERSAEERGVLQEQLKKAEKRQSQLEGVSNTLCQLNEKKRDLAAAESKMADLLGNNSLHELRGSVDTTRRQVNALALKAQLATIAMELLRRVKDDILAPCPVCGNEHDRERLKSAIQAESDEGREQELVELREAERILQEAESLAERIEREQREKEELEQELAVAMQEIDDMTDPNAGQLDEGLLDKEVASILDEKNLIKAQLDNRQAWIDELNKQLSGLREEARYHDIQKELLSLRSIETEFNRVERVYEDLVRFGESVRDIRDGVASALTEELKTKTPRVAQNLTQVYAALTRHPYFNQLVFNEEKLPRLELRVSSAASSTATYPTGVLNGQAQSALELVPYFALGQANEAPTEVYLVLLDDPTRAFDKEHIEILIQRLADLGQRVQIVVASQETDTFRKLLPRSFDREDYVVIEPKDWSFEEGPELEVEYE